jgi:glycerophosphoryl diester phosphodiesterase
MPPSARSADTAIAAEERLREHAQGESALFHGPVEALSALRSRCPEARTMLTWDQPGLPPEDLWMTLRPAYYSSHYSLLTRDLIAKVRGSGYAVCAWTVNDFPEMARSIGMGVDAVMTECVADLVTLTGDAAPDTAVALGFKKLPRPPSDAGVGGGGLGGE